jgi:hypothetical protein
MRSRQFTPAEIAGIARRAYRVRSGAYVFDPPQNGYDLHRLRARAVVENHQTGVAASHGTAALLHKFAVPQGALRAVHISGVQHDSDLSSQGIGTGDESAELPDDSVASGGPEPRPAATGSRCQACGVETSRCSTDQVSAPDPSIVAATTIRGGLRNGVHTHVTPLPCRQVEWADGFMRTTAARTVVDCSLTLPFDAAVVIADQALNKGSTTLPQLESILKSLGRRKGVGQARRVLAAADPGAGSPGETLLRIILTQAGIEVESQVELFDKLGQFLGRVDLVVKGFPVVIEFDGRAKYQLGGDIEQAHWEEKCRHDDLENAGYIVRRFRWEQFSRPQEILRIVLEAMSIAAQGS